MEIHCVKPQILPHRNKVPTKVTISWKLKKKKLVMSSFTAFQHF